MTDRRTLLRQTADLAADFLDGLPNRLVRARATHAELLEGIGGRCPIVARPPARSSTTWRSPPTRDS